MRLREREADSAGQPDAGAEGGSDLDAARAAGMRLLSAADAAIDRVVSSDSTRFLGSIRQHHGE